MQVLTSLPVDLPRPVDDGACDHLPGMRLPELALNSTQGGLVALASLPGRVLVYCYPMTGQPGVPLPDGWDQIPGARGSTPQSCGLRDHHAELQALHTQVFGLSTQTTAYQAEAATRLHLPFALLSDVDLAFSQALRLPMLEVNGMQLIRRLTLIVDDGVISKVFYPVFPPDQHAQVVLDWLNSAP